MDTPAEKLCKTCGHIKPCSDFAKDASHADGLRSMCKSCHHQREQERKTEREPNSICKFGHHPFYLPPALKARGGDYCSREHRVAAERLNHATMTAKFCPSCGVIKPLEEFYRHVAGVGGRQYACKACTDGARKAERRARGLRGPTKPNLAMDPKTGRFVSVKPVAERFWEKVDQSMGPEGCWPWTGRIHTDGYGQYGVGDGHGHVKNVHAHRFGYELLHGPQPAGTIIRHRCDNPICCNPMHLLPGTHKDNAQDREERGRGVKGRPSPIAGERHPNVRLTKAQAQEILAAKGVKLARQLAVDYGVSIGTILAIWSRHSWKSLDS